MSFKLEETISTLSGKHLKWLDQFIYLGRNISSTESCDNIGLGKSLTAIDWLSIICKSDVFDKIKRDFLQAVAVLVLLNGCTTRTQRKHLQKNVDSGYTRILHVALS